MKKKSLSNVQEPEAEHAEPDRVSVRVASQKERQPVPVLETTVLLVEMLPELGLVYVQDAFDTRFIVDGDTEGHAHLTKGVRYRALVNSEGYVLKIQRKPN